ncbi:MAG: hypothetical protein ABI577_02705 [bacterium]
MEIARAREHRPREMARSDARKKVHGAGAIGRFNARLALGITSAVGSMWCAYAFMGLALVSLPTALQSGDRVIIVSWISQTFLQLVLLSVIIVGQNVQAAATDGRAEADHETLDAVHTLAVAIHSINQQQIEILRRLDKLS